MPEILRHLFRFGDSGAANWLAGFDREDQILDLFAKTARSVLSQPKGLYTTDAKPCSRPLERLVRPCSFPSCVSRSIDDSQTTWRESPMAEISARGWRRGVETGGRIGRRCGSAVKMAGSYAVTDEVRSARSATSANASVYFTEPFNDSGRGSTGPRSAA
jgi:hypothetical protein